MTNHTQEDNSVLQLSELMRGLEIPPVSASLDPGQLYLNEANASRIVACVNACVGVSDDALDGGWEAAGLSAYAKRLEVDLAAVTAQRDELLAALKIVTTGTVQTLMKHNKEWKALVAKCEAKP